MAKAKKVRAQRSPSTSDNGADGSLGEWLHFLGAMPADADWIPVWPPDAFAIAAALLRRTGAYVRLVNGSPSRNKKPARGRTACDVGAAWRQTLEATLQEGKSSGRLREACPPEIKQWWAHMLRCRTRALAECAADGDLIAAAVNLCIAGDAACKEIGIIVDRDPFLLVAESVLGHNDRRSLCLHVPVEKLAVLPKRHTPQRGCTIRSLTHNLALFTPTEIRAFWQAPYEAAAGDLDIFNLLLLPWPVQVRPGDFRVALDKSGGRIPALSVNQRYFDYEPAAVEKPARLAARVEQALAIATREVDRIHGVVLPELSLTRDQFAAVERVAVKWRAILISGIRSGGSRQTNGMPSNACAIQPLGLTALRELTTSLGRIADLTRKVQSKHHRWCLDRGQILQYELGGRLPPERDCWEHMFIGDREIHFLTFSSWLTTCVLICEDLARQDPVTEVIRSVGPNLVFALLMDGPQLRNRWPSRYASVFAEDPGCSVLSMTSLGMARMSKPSPTSGDVVDKSSTIALWRDAIYGEREIALGPGHDACVLSLVNRTAQEFTIDGRLESRQASFPVYANILPFSTVQGSPSARRPRRAYTGS